MDLVIPSAACSCSLYFCLWEVNKQQDCKGRPASHCPLPILPYWRPKWKCSLRLWMCPFRYSTRCCLLEECNYNHGNKSRASVLGIDPRRYLQRILGLLCQIGFVWTSVYEVFIWSSEINRAFKYRLGRETLALGKELGAYFCDSLRDIYFCNLNKESEERQKPVDDTYSLYTLSYLIQ